MCCAVTKDAARLIEDNEIITLKFILEIQQLRGEGKKA
jgi:hypothetical protein